MKYVYFLCAASLVAGSAVAGEPPAASDRGARPPHADGSGHARQDKRAGPHGAASGERPHRMDRHGRDGGPDDSADRGDGDRPGRPRHGLRRELHAKFRDKNAKPDELKKQIGEWREARETRREDNRRMLVRRWGPALSKGNVTEELQLHARRLSRLQRMEELAATERKGDERSRLLEKIDKLRERETERHERAMQRLTSGQPTPSASGSAAPPSAVPATSGGTP